MTHPSPSTPRSSRRRWWIAPSVLVLGLYAGFFAFAVAQACTIGDVTGQLDCVQQTGANDFVAWFGYYNQSGVVSENSVSYDAIILGPSNNGTITDSNPKNDGSFGQPFKFQSGQSDFVFGVKFSTSQGVKWQVSNHGTYPVATTSSPRCATITATAQPPTPVGQPVTLNGDVTVNTIGHDSKHNITNTPTKPTSGVVTFFEGGSTLGGNLVNNIGHAQTKPITNLSVGPHHISATYTPPTNTPWYTAYTTVDQQITPLVNSTCSVVASPNPSLLHQAVTFTATIGDANKGTPTGSITFTGIPSGNVTSTLVNGTATTFTSDLGIGPHTIGVSYGGDSTHNRQTCSVPQQVNPIPTTTTVVSSQNPTVQGQGVTFTATVAPVAPNICTLTGQVTFTIPGTKPDTETVIGGKATTATSITTVPLGANAVTAVYSGDATCVSSTGTTTQTVGTVSPPPSGNTNSYFRIAQAANNSLAVDVSIDSATNFPNLTACTVGSYYPLSAGSHTITISANGKTLYSQAVTFTAGDYYTLGFVDDASATPAVTPNLVVFQDDLSVVPGKAKARVYHLSDSAGPVSIATNGTIVLTSLSFENASSYLVQTPGAENYLITPLSKVAKTENVPINEAANQVYSLFLMCGDDAQTKASGGIPTALPQTGYAPVIPGVNWNAIAFFMGALAVIGAGLGGVSGLAVVQYRRRHR